MGNGILSRANSGDGAKIGTIRLSARDSLGEKWALCNGDPVTGSIGVIDPFNKNNWIDNLNFGLNYRNLRITYDHVNNKYYFVEAGDTYLTIGELNTLDYNDSDIGSYNILADLFNDGTNRTFIAAQYIPYNNSIVYIQYDNASTLYIGTFDIEFIYLDEYRYTIFSIPDDCVIFSINKNLFIDNGVNGYHVIDLNTMSYSSISISDKFSCTHMFCTCKNYTGVIDNSGNIRIFDTNSTSTQPIYTYGNHNYTNSTISSVIDAAGNPMFVVLSYGESMGTLDCESYVINSANTVTRNTNFNSQTVYLDGLEQDWSSVYHYIIKDTSKNQYALLSIGPNDTRINSIEIKTGYVDTDPALDTSMSCLKPGISLGFSFIYPYTTYNCFCETSRINRWYLFHMPYDTTDMVTCIPCLPTIDKLGVNGFIKIKN